MCVNINYKQQNENIPVNMSPSFAPHTEGDDTQ